MKRIFRYWKANKLAKKKAAQLKENCLAVVQFGSSLRIRDFALCSDVDLVAVYVQEPEEKNDFSYEEDIEITVIQKSESDFLEGLERGNPFFLTALKYGKFLWDKDWIANLQKRDFRPKKLTFDFKLQSALNHYSELLRGIHSSIEFYNACYHSYRAFCRYLILKYKGQLVEGDQNTKRTLQRIPQSRQFADKFWSFRQKRLFPPPFDEEYIETEDIFEHKFYQEIKLVEEIGEQIFKMEELYFPSLKILKEKLSNLGVHNLSSPIMNFMRKEVSISGRKDGEFKLFCFNMEDGSLTALKN